MFLLLACIVWPIAITAILVEMWILMAVGVLWLVVPPWRPALARTALSLMVAANRASRMMNVGYRW